MAAAQTFNITQTSLQNAVGATQSLVVLCTPQPTSVGGTSVASPYTFPYTIATPSAAQIAKYVPGGTITLTSDT